MIHVVAAIKIDASRREEFLAEFAKLVPLVLAEEGCLEYGPTVDLSTNIEAQGDAREDVVTVIEKWESVPALEAHLIAPHMLAYREKVKSLVLGMTLRILQPA